MWEKSKILVIGGTGLLGKLLVEASVNSGHPTYALVRKASLSCPDQSNLVESFKHLGVHILYGELEDYESVVKAIKLVDVVISSVGHSQIFNQIKIIDAIKEAGNVKRFFPSDFETDVDRTTVVKPGRSFFSAKAQIRRAIEAERIAHTFVSCNCFAGYFLPTLVQFNQTLTSPPRDKVTIYGDGNAKAIINKEEDIAAYTIRAVDDPTTLNKVLYVNPPDNIVSMNDLVTLWENKIGKTLEKTYFPEEELLKQIQELPTPINAILSMIHAIFCEG
ncbi:PREDICTED: isoflavone reductase homolog P3-like [Tarenaya hassleriana]|uniref:isoflavone reductase homolog P3-like n=1 Tax=Tarenaya hassleriana TaxID=28532 RepID=UPI00053C33D7|nr:PREDICTED: isoflavone reductase homolog P3-like [Tarenaya hassleriana]